MAQEVVAMQAVDDSLLHGDGAGGARQTIQQGQLAEAVARPMEVERDLLARFAEQEDAHSARLHKIQRVARCVAMKNYDAGGEGVPAQVKSQRVQLDVGQSGEESRLA